MLFARWVRPHRVFVVLVAVAAVAVGAFACRDTTTSQERSTAGITDPRFTAAVDFNGTSLGRGNLGAFHVESNAAHFNVELNSHNNTDIAVSSIVVPPGGHSGWHYHPGPVLVVVTKGTITFYHGSDPTCSGMAHPMGTAFVEEGGDVGIARNEGTGLLDTAKVVATYFAPPGVATRLDAPRPGNCTF